MCCLVKGVCMMRTFTDICVVYAWFHVYTFYEQPYALCTAPKSNAIQRKRSEKNPFHCEVPFFFLLEPYQSTVDSTLWGIFKLTGCGAVVLNYFRIEVCSFVLPVFSTIQYTVWLICFWKSFWKTTLKKMLTSPMSGLPCILHWVWESLLWFGLQDQRSCSPLHLEFTVTLCEQHWLNTCNKKQISMFSLVSFCYPRK